MLGVAKMLEHQTDTNPTSAVSTFGQFCLPIFACLSGETLKAVGPFFMVSTPREVKYPNHRSKCVTCRGRRSSSYILSKYSLSWANVPVYNSTLNIDSLYLQYRPNRPYIHRNISQTEPKCELLEKVDIDCFGQVVKPVCIVTHRRTCATQREL